MTCAQDEPAAAPGTDRSRNGCQRRGVVRGRLVVLLNEGIGDTIRVSLTPRPGGDRREEVYAACEILRPSACDFFAGGYRVPGLRPHHVEHVPGARGTHADVRLHVMPVWKTRHPGVETMSVAVMGCVVNGPVSRRPRTSDLTARHG